MIFDLDYLEDYEYLHFLERTSHSNLFRSRSLQTYVSPLKLHDEKRIYRSVFERNEISFMRIEFSFFNKKFDEEQWEANVRFILYRIEKDEQEPIELDKSDFEYTVRTSENIVNLSHSWGNDEPGSAWQEGIYRYEVWVNQELADHHYFYVQDHGFVIGKNPYFNIYSLRLFESGSQSDSPANRQYMMVFQPEMTRFIWVELELENRLASKYWMGEFTFKFFNDALLLVGSKDVMLPVITTNKNNAFRIEAGIGHESQVSWLKDKYKIEVWFMGYKIASTSFEVGDKPVRGLSSLELPDHENTESITSGHTRLSSSEDKKVVQLLHDEILKDLDGMVGLDTIRKRLSDYISFVQYQQLMEKRGLKSGESVNLHAVFMGNPGTGKTTVAKALGKVYHQLGLLPRDTVFEADRSSLIGRYIGETAPMTQDVIEKARGGILFIDEAYALSKPSDEKDFGRESLEVILRELSDGPGDLAVIVAGYPKQMNTFLEFNPGLKSRFQNIYEFPDYMPDELLQIAHIKAKRKKLSISKKAENVLLQILSEEFRKRDKNFGNARLVGSVIESAQINLGVRIMKHSHPGKLSLKEISTIKETDLECISLKPGHKKPVLPVQEELLKQATEELNQLTGIEVVKSEVHDLIKLVRFHKEMNKNILHSFSLHNVFLGNPGTGKTTVARLMAKIFKALGLLERGHLVECNRENLVAGFVGQTAIKTNDLIDRALGGVLFIDEAYSLVSNGSAGDYGREAVEILLKRMEDERGNFSLIMAGYTKEMQVFLDTNPGLRSRLDNHILFEDFSSEELKVIAFNMLSNKGIVAENDALQILNDYLEMHAGNRDRFFGNARFVRKVVEKVLRNQLLRLGSLDISKRTEKMMQTLTREDVQELTKNSDVLQNSPVLGFRMSGNFNRRQ